MPCATLDGIETHWRIFGAGPRPALLIHCSLGHSGGWSALAARLGDLLTMTAFDLPGHGRSGAWAEGEAREVQGASAGMARGLLPEAGQVDLIGHSFGATVALRLAVERPERVRSLTLIEPVFFRVARLDDPAAAARLDASSGPFAAAWRVGNREGAARHFMRLWGDGARWDALPEAQRARLAAQIHLIPAASAALDGDVGGLLPRLDRIAVPALLLEGDESPGVIPVIQAGLAARLPNARRAVLRGAGHMAPMTHPDAVAREIRTLLAES